MTAKLFLTSSVVVLATVIAAGAPALAQNQPPGGAEPPAAAPPRTYQAPEEPGTTPGDRTDLGRDCAGIESRAQRTVCLNRDLAALDRDAQRLGGADHAAWAAKLESCAATSNTVYDGPIYRCLKARYEARLVELSRMDGGTMSGQYRLVGGANSGSMTVVEWPQQHVTVLFEKITAAGARVCTFRMDAPASAGVIEGRPSGLPGCRVSVALGRGTATVQSNGCEGLCEMGERVDGTYTSLGAVAPGAPPSRGAPAPSSPRQDD